MTFDQLNLIEPILKALSQEGYTTPTPIQEQAIPILLQQQDLLGCAQTGTGKTAAFAIPILQLLYNQKQQSTQPPAIKVLILTPTRELAIQIEDSFKSYGKYTGITQTVVFGGVGQKPQTDALRRGVDVLVATPGRLLDLMQQGFVRLQHLQFFVLDEADRMLDMGFVNDVKKIIAKIPERRQTLLFSATMPKEIMALANSILHNPQQVSVTPVSSTAETIEQRLFYVDKNEKRDLLKLILEDKEIKTALVFTRTKHGADKVVKDLIRSEISAEAIHGNKSQNARQKALSNFKAQRTRVLVATDIAARGIDIDDLTHVINFDLPNVPESYVHRIGRTGRAGASGIAYSFCEQEEVPYVKDIQKLINMPIQVAEHPFHKDFKIGVAIAPQVKPKPSSQQRNRTRQASANANSKWHSAPRAKRPTHTTSR
ncbi:MAG: DEAD/DEAH box helicase [Bacteroidetes bacterium]|nr:DEAD/DEAH box helicase [Bacteroidota bacterium]